MSANHILGLIRPLRGSILSKHCNRFTNTAHMHKWRVTNQRRNLIFERNSSSIQIHSLPPSASTDILNKQRLLRPTSPYMTIYKPQLTSVLSISNRAAGNALSILLYGFSLSYLFAPGMFDSTHIVEFASGLPDSVKYACKAILAAPFAFHSLSGVRHLSWDLGKLMTIRGVYQTGYAVLAGTAVSTVALMLL
ncbi:Cytochrome b subunit of succinate dehydrogenase SDH3 [Mycena sanguinolenta]|uniref:Cytochrome b subunit of succinate dehydrogenase SDH3 n=1 Tax=Mycena sanguinolenta TaxID=230812 RepID=A0A8H7DE37_9AGAR|nr:Cytochrome b subunit of succinate dehydrogenase SDH3 [Mycena sanguinolenta]